MTATANVPAHVAERVALADSWLLWRDFAVRSAGFPIDGLGVFGPGDESARLRAVARDPAFREAMTWQNPAAVANALDKLGDAAGSSTARRREDVVASYWQRYCAQNDTIGFYGPLAWGRVADWPSGALHAHSGSLIRRRSVHLETWAIQALAASIDPGLRVALGPHSEDHLRALLEEHPDARPLAYVDCMRDLDVTLGPEFLEGLEPALAALFEAGRWYCGRIQAIGEAVIAAALPEDGERMPFGAVVARILPQLMQLPPAIGAEVAELQRRMAALIADPDVGTLAARARIVFADHRPAWPLGCYQSVDVQIAARDEQAIRDGDYLAVIGDMHPGSNPLLQGRFGNHHPSPARMYELVCHEAGAEVVDADGELRVCLAQVFAMPISVMAVRTFEPWAAQPHQPRLTVGRVVLRREAWAVAADEIPDALDAWARDLGMPRRVFVKTPNERKPFYLDLDSAVLRRIALRHIRAAAGREEPVRFTEMLPGPDRCWLSDAAGRRYASELRLVGVEDASVLIGSAASAGPLTWRLAQSSA